MDPKTVNTILLLEQLIVMAVKAAAELSAVAKGAAARDLNQVLDDSDRRYLKILSTSMPTGPDPVTT